MALGLLAFDFAGDKASAVLGTAFAIKMIACVGLSSVANAVSERLPRKAVLIGSVTASVCQALTAIRTCARDATKMHIDRTGVSGYSL